MRIKKAGMATKLVVLILLLAVSLALLSVMTPGCPERYDWAFLWYVWRFRRNYMERINETLQNFHGEVIRLKSPAEAKRFLADIDRHENQ